MIIPYVDIIETGDRKWTGRLLDRLSATDHGDGELDHLIEALQAVSDPRSLAPLEAICCDATRPPAIREAASSVLRGMDYLVPDVSERKLRRWWDQGDPLLQRHALLSMSASDCPDVLVAVASDANHPLQVDALGMMTINFDRPRHMHIKIQALRHPDARVRETAATVLFWDEPVHAEFPLIQATNDPVPPVAAEACATLHYYHSLRAAYCLHDLLDHPAKRVRTEAEISFTNIRQEFLYALTSKDGRVGDHIRQWLAEAWPMLAFTEQELHPVEHGTSAEQPADSRENLPAAALLAILGDPDASAKMLQQALRTCQWQRYTVSERQELHRALTRHPDPFVRAESAGALATWGESSAVLELLEDADFGVRKMAMCRLADLPPTPVIADVAWRRLHRPDALGIHATETLQTFVRHAEPSLSTRRLGWIVGDHGYSESLRYAAVYQLVELAAREEIGQLTGLLQEAPEITWDLHVALLNSIRTLDLPKPRIDYLREVDNVHLQEAIAPFSP